MRALVLGLLLLGCGGDDSTVDASVDASFDAATDAPADDSGSRDAGAMDASDAEALPACPNACVASEPWRCDRCLPTDLQEITAVVWNDRIAVLGGFEPPVRIVGTLRLYDPATDRWSEGPTLPVGRHHVMLAVHDGDLYAIGGMQTAGFDALRTSFVLRADAEEWIEIASPPRARAAGFAATVGDRIIVAGGQGEGRSDGERMDDGAPVLIYDPAGDSWSEGAPIPTPREHCAGVEHDGELWIFGGRQIRLEPTSDVVEIYDVAADEWRTGPAMPSAHGGFAAALWNGVAYVSGGEERARALDTVEALDLSGGPWRTLDPIPTPRHGHAMAALDGRVYVIGGADEPVFAAVDVVESFAAP